MTERLRALLSWYMIAPVVAAAALAAGWGRTLPGAVVIVFAVLLAAATLAAVHHAEVVAHRVGEPYGSLVLAVAVTVIEVALIVTMMISGGQTQTLARDTVFAAVMITCNGIVGASLLVGTWRHDVVAFNAEGSGAALATVATLATLCLVLPTFTQTTPGPAFTASQLGFAAVTSLALYALFVLVQTVRHRDYFLPRTGAEDTNDEHADEHAAPPPAREALISLLLLVVALVAVVGNAKLVSPTIERAVEAAGLPLSLVAVIIALLVLLPETLSAVRAAQQNRLQVSLNLALGSAMASIGLTIPTIAVVSFMMDAPLHLGLGGTDIVLLALTVGVAVLTIVPGRALLLHAGVHLAILAAYLFLAIVP
jgi:Ca2+:H+ antiporter